jgi:UDP-N-acetylglucosamine--N-acetylmuramyl-(pentapeptide) pyrophosphoryl-undecaprenol N-acetylglucosamine transferase
MTANTTPNNMANASANTSATMPVSGTVGKRLLIMAAGTGGHIFPGLAIAQTMQQRGWHVTWLGTTHGMEGRLVPQSGIAMDTIEFSGMRGKGWRHTLSGAWKLVASFGQCFRLLGQRKPDVVLGMGGYVTLPGGLMARLRGLPLLVVNADAGLLLSNKVLLPFAKRVLFGFPAQTADGQASSKAVVTGNPVRQEIWDIANPQQRYAARSGPLQLLVVGGSLGAQVLNRAVPQALARLPVEKRPKVTHQSGAQHIEALRAAYAEAGVEAEVLPFIDDMAAQYTKADLVICRAGAITVSELTVAGLASVLVPFVASTTSHQIDNAVWMAAQQASRHVPQKELTPEHLAALLTSLTRADCQAMAERAWALGRRDAKQEIARMIEQYGTDAAQNTGGTAS